MRASHITVGACRAGQLPHVLARSVQAPRLGLRIGTGAPARAECFGGCFGTSPRSNAVASRPVSRAGEGEGARGSLWAAPAVSVSARQLEAAAAGKGWEEEGAPSAQRAQLGRSRRQEQLPGAPAGPALVALGPWVSRMSKTAAILALAGVLALGSAVPAQAAMSGGRMGGSSFSRSSFSSSRGASSSRSSFSSSRGASSSRSSGSSGSGSSRSSGSSGGGGSSHTYSYSSTVIVPSPSPSPSIWLWSPGAHSTPAVVPAAPAGSEASEAVTVAPSASIVADAPADDETADGTEADEDSEEALATLLVLIFVIWLLAGL